MIPFSNCSDPSLKPTPWGVWATLGFSALLILGNVLGGIMIAAGFASSTGKTDFGTDLAQLASNGTLVTLSILFSSLIVSALTLLFANLRRQITVKTYLGLHEIDWKTAAKWLLILLLFAAAADGVTFMLKRPIVQDFLLNVYLTSTSKPLLLFALVLAVPVSEEVFFRGFLFYGILHSRLGPIGAITLSSLIWAPLHLQYDLFNMATVLLLGFLFGYARLKTNSVYIPIAMHAMMNFIATMEVMIHVIHPLTGS